MLQFIGNGVSSLLQNTALIAVNAAVAATVTGLSAMTLIAHFEDTPELRTLQCALGFERADCPEAQAEKKRLKDNLAAMTRQRDAIAGQIAGLRAVQNAVDEITLFVTHDDPHSDLEITVGTVYAEFVNAKPEPESHFCYIVLKNGAAGESRNLHFHSSTGRRSISGAALRDAGVSRKTLNYGRKVCKPLLIGHA